MQDPFICSQITLVSLGDSVLNLSTATVAKGSCFSFSLVSQLSLGVYYL